jgi:hypothetical protein
MAELLTEPVGPEDVALLVGLPLDRDAFQADIDWRRRMPRDGRGDFALSQTFGMSDEEAWTSHGQPLCELVTRLIGTARDVGILPHRIVPAAGLDDIDRVADDGARVIAIVAYWRAANVAGVDLDETSWPSIAARIGAADGGVLYELNRFLQDSRVDDRLTRARLADQLDAFIESYGSTAETSEIVRDALDATLPGLLAPGNCIELRDGLHKARVLATALPDAWSGVVDLSVCHSMTLATALRGGRPDRRVISNTKPKYLDRVVPELRETFTRLAYAPAPYVSLRAQVACIYGTQLLEATR